MKKVYEHGPVRITVELPDLPETVEVEKPELDIRATTEEDAHAVVEAFGGLTEWDFGGHHSGEHALVRPAGFSYTDPVQLNVWLPTGRLRKVPDAPFIAELRKAQAQAALVAK